MADVTVGSWNMHNAFGDERAPGALEVIDRMNADVIYLCEMTHRDTANGEEFLGAAEAMRGLGYTQSLTSDYSPDPEVRNLQTMGMWGRDSVAAISRGTYGQRYGLKAEVPAMDLTVFGVHLDDRHETQRTDSAWALLRDYFCMRRESPDHEAAAIGDFNGLHRADPKSALLRMLNQCIGWIEVKDYYNDNKKLQRFAGKVLRVCRSAKGETLGVFSKAKFRDADPHYNPTWGTGNIALQLDHILTSHGLHATNFQRHYRRVSPDSRPLSDHAPITATLVRHEAPSPVAISLPNYSAPPESS